MVPPKIFYLFYLPISKLYSILAISNLLAHNNISISYYVQVNSLRLKSSVTLKWASKQLGVPFILLLMDGTRKEVIVSSFGS